MPAKRYGQGFAAHEHANAVRERAEASGIDRELIEIMLEDSDDDDADHTPAFVMNRCLAMLEQMPPAGHIRALGKVAEILREYRDKQ